MSKMLKLKREDIMNMHKDMLANDDIKEIHVPLQETTFLDLIAHYEDVQFTSFNSYNDIDTKMQLEHRLRSIIRELNIVEDVCQNALERINLEVNPSQIYGIRLLTEEPVQSKTDEQIRPKKEEQNGKEMEDERSTQ